MTLATEMVIKYYTKNNKSQFFLSSVGSRALLKRGFLVTATSLCFHLMSLCPFGHEKFNVFLKN